MKGSRVFVFMAFGFLSLGLGLSAVFPSMQIQLPDKDRVVAAWEKSGAPGGLTITYPRDHTLFPPEIIPPTVIWEDESGSSDLWLLLAARDGKVEVISEFSEDGKIRLNPESWKKIKRISQGKPVKLVVLGLARSHPDTIVSGGEVMISTSRDEVGAPVFYRDVPLPFEYAYKNLDTIRWRLGDIAADGPTHIMLENLPLCGNCHSFSQDGRILAMDVDYANDKGSYVISSISQETRLTPAEIITWSDFKREDGEMTFGLLSQVSPDGRYVLSTVKDRSIFVPVDNLPFSQLFFPIKGIICVYDRETKRFWSLPGADDPDFCQSNPTWSPDGETIIFARAPVYHSKVAESFKQAVLPTEAAAEFLEGRRGFQYDLCRVPFNRGRGGAALPIPGASGNGMSNYFPRISPDGRWIVFSQAKNFMLLQPDSKLIILPMQGGEPRVMNCNQTSMNSWHSWSPNGKWLIFASKERGPYTQLYLTHIDRSGEDTPAVLLENFNLPERAVNIPEFVNIDKTKWSAIINDFMESGNYYIRIGEDKYIMGDSDAAIEAYNKALEYHPTSADIYIKRGDAKFQKEDFRSALEDYNHALEINAALPIAYKNRGDVKFRMGDLISAIEDYNEAILLNPGYYEAYDRRGNVKLESKDLEGALQDLSKAIEIKPDESALYGNRAFIKLELKDWRGAEEDYDRALELNPRSITGYKYRGDAKLRLGDFSGALADYDKAVELNPEYYLAFERRADARYALGDFSGVIADLNTVIAVNPQNFFLFSRRGDAKFELRDFTGAVEDYNRSIDLRPDFALNYFKRGMVEIISGLKDEGCQDLQKAHELGYQGAMEQIEKYCGR